MSEATPLTVNTFEDAKEIYRQKSLRQALYDAGEIVMSGVLVNLHGDEHRARRRLENRLFRRETLVSYERDFFPSLHTTPVSTAPQEHLKKPTVCTAT